MNGSTFRWTSRTGVALLLGLLVTRGASAREVAPDSRSEGGRIRELEARVRALESRAATAPATPPVTAGRNNGLFFLRSSDGAFTLFPTARMQIDAYAYSPAFEAPGQPRASVFLRRVRPELLGSLFHERVDFMLAGDFAAPANGQATTDAFVIFNVHDWLHVQVGQFDLPFTMENRTSDRVIDFMERSFTVRNLGTSTKEPGLMLWGGPRSRLFYYSVGLFNGDGINVRNLDNSFDVVGRIFVRPFAAGAAALSRVQVGASGSFGSHRDTNQPIGAAPGWLSLESGYPLFRNTYTGADGNGTAIAVVPQGDVARVAAEVNVPIGPVAFRAEGIWLKGDVAETFFASGLPLRGVGSLRALGGYAQLAFWPIGTSRVLSDPGVGSMPRFVAGAQTPPDGFNLQLVARAEYDRVDYQSGAPLGANQQGPSQVAGAYTYWSAGFSANLWWTRHVRLTLNYVANHIEGATANLPSPGQNFIHEFGARVGLSL
ncbi:MAG: hypothetical protein EPO40_08440 [Myxococcaceae bacterium]|nr:MAG: hypothetical protein EPO40_08440 [Myxococcaceae bacterium]